MPYLSAHIKALLLASLLLFNLSAFSQDKGYAKACIAKLSSPEFHGRAYVKKGDKKAAKFIKDELIKWGAKPFGDSYYQQVSFNINTTKKAQIELDEQVMTLGVDYLVHSASTSLKGKYELYLPESNFSLSGFLSENHKNKIFVLDTIDNKSKDLIDNYKSILGSCAFKNAAGVVEVTDRKLIQTMSTFDLGYAFIQFAKTSWKQDAKSIKVNIKTQLKSNYPSQNIIAYIEGEIDSFYVFSAHYDHLGRVAKDVYFPGANDNASGTATVLNLAKHYATSRQKPRYSIAFMLFTGEEAGLLGSHYYTEHPLFPLEKIKFLINLDMVGTGEEGLSVVNGKTFPKAGALIQKINTEKAYFDDIKLRTASSNSDHAYFYKKGVPSVFMYTRGGAQFYHDIYDRIETLSLNKHEVLIQLLLEFTNRYE